MLRMRPDGHIVRVCHVILCQRLRSLHSVNSIASSDRTKVAMQTLLNNDFFAGGHIPAGLMAVPFAGRNHKVLTVCENTETSFRPFSGEWSMARH